MLPPLKETTPYTKMDPFRIRNKCSLSDKPAVPKKNVYTEPNTKSLCALSDHQPRIYKNIEGPAFQCLTCTVMRGRSPILEANATLQDETVESVDAADAAAVFSFVTWGDA